MKTTNKDGSLRFFGIPKMIPLVKRFSKQVWIISLSALACGILDLLGPLFNRYALNHFVTEGTLDGLPVFIILYVAMLALFAITAYINIRVQISTEVTMNRDMRNDAFTHLQELSFDYYSANSVGYIHARAMSDTSRIGNLFSQQISDTVEFLFYIVGAIVIMLSINVKLTGAVLIIVPIIALFFSLFYGKLFKLGRETREINSKITGNFNEGITGAKTIKSLVIEDRIDEDFRSETTNMFKKALQLARHRSVFASVTDLAASFALAFVLWKGGILAKEQVGTFSMFMSYAQGLMEPVRWLVETLALFVNGKVNIERYTKLMETVPSVNDTPEVIEKYGDAFAPRKENWEDLKGDIEFKNVDFKYPGADEYVLKDFDLKIPFGTNVAIVGETGAGKSTMANLICRFYEPTEGQILVDGRDYRERSQLWLHSALGYVLQTPHLFSGTIRDNLLYGNENATDEEIAEAIKMVSAEGLIEKLDDGLDTDVGEGGDLLSTGEKQLISFARAILAKPKIIILDEATASVDTITEQKIQSAIDKVVKGRTSIVIAHRLSTIRNADIILVVDNGQIVERGRHEELLAKKGHYYRLWTRQYEDDAMAAVWSSGGKQTVKQ
ncbi:MAG: ABC transporter ATP-binding protein/permease [Clostridia bacterium]|nr:ABC transporter ATP-binding protein/permease [Clostridia bacterium]